MPGSTPKLAIPYALPGEDVREYPTAVDKPAAERIEAVVLRWASSITMPDVAANNAITAAVTFPAGFFTATPVQVSVTPGGTSWVFAGSSTSNPTPSGFTAYLRNIDVTAKTGIRLHIIAVGS